MMNVMGKYPMTDWEIPIVTNMTTLVYPDTNVSPTQYLVINRGCLRLSVKMLSNNVSTRVTLFNCGKFEHIKSFLCFKQARLYVITHKTPRQVYIERRWDSNCIDQHVHMHMLIKVFTLCRCIIAIMCRL